MSGFQQVRAIAWLRWRLLVNHVRARRSAMAGEILFLGLSLVISLALATVTWTLIRRAVLGGDAELLFGGFQFAFWLAAIAAIIPLVISGGSQSLSVSRLLGYPIRRHELHAASLAASTVGAEHLFGHPVLLASFVAGVVLGGVSLGVGTALFGLFLLVLVAWTHGIGLTLHGLMKTRRGREVLGIAAISVVILVGVSPALISGWSESRGLDDEAVMREVLGSIGDVLGLLPPATAARGVEALHRGEPAAALGAAIVLLGWLVVGLGLGHVVFVRYHLSVPRGTGPSGGGAGGSVSAGSTWFDSLAGATASFLPTEALAVAAKELRYLRRSTFGKITFAISPIMVVMFVFIPGVFEDSGFLGLAMREALFHGLLLYALLLSNNYFANWLAWDGEGVKSFWLYPVPLRSVILGKNLAAWTFSTLLFLLSLLTWSVTAGVPGLRALLTGPLVYAAGVLVFTLVGNWLSLRYPTAWNPGSVVNQLPGGSLLFSIASLLGITLVTGACLSFPVLLGQPWLQPVALLALVTGLAWFYRRSLDDTAQQLHRGKERVLEVLSGATS
ncbi:MAG: hypothetical protein AAF533_28100 [Acidobacteriota bacterium]